ncbi:MAG TPA: biotin transporter BioY, partial [Candidatus Polarisedimenticolia bacterium]|nr:biotin transporter BioY [Candidatus Polarisedimenticolia bacterium]
RTIVMTALAMLVGNLIIYALGLTWLTIQIGISDAIKYGIVPFLVLDAIKIALATCGLPLAWRGISKKN